MATAKKTVGIPKIDLINTVISFFVTLQRSNADKDKYSKMAIELADGKDRLEGSLGYYLNISQTTSKIFEDPVLDKLEERAEAIAQKIKERKADLIAKGQFSLEHKGFTIKTYNSK